MRVSIFRLLALFNAPSVKPSLETATTLSAPTLLRFSSSCSIHVTSAFLFRSLHSTIVRKSMLPTFARILISTSLFIPVSTSSIRSFFLIFAPVPENAISISDTSCSNFFPFLFNARTSRNHTLSSLTISTCRDTPCLTIIRIHKCPQYFSKSTIPYILNLIYPTSPLFSQIYFQLALSDQPNTLGIENNNPESALFPLNLIYIF